MVRAKKQSSSQDARRKQPDEAGHGSADAAEEKEMGAIEMLKGDHRKVEKLFKELEASNDRRRREDLVDDICREFMMHTLLEEEVFYPAVLRADEDNEELGQCLDRGQVEHDMAKMVVNELVRDPRGPYSAAKAEVLRQLIEHHVEEEEGKDGTFALARTAGIDDMALAERMRRRKGELERRGTGSFRVLSFEHLRRVEESSRRRPAQEHVRDEEERAYYGRDRYDDDDYRHGHGGWYGDPRGHSQAAHRGWRARGGRYEGDQDDDYYRDERGARGYGYRRA